jgi:uncharacterized protein DUF6221
VAVTLAAFLLARIDDDRRQAEQATPGPWHDVRIDDGTDGWNVEARGAQRTDRDVAVDHARPAEGACRRSDAAHIARWHPARVLAECDAKRRIIELQRSDLRDDPQDWEADEVLRLLALPYAGHPDYRAEWRP